MRYLANFEKYKRPSLKIRIVPLEANPAGTSCHILKATGEMRRTSGRYCTEFDVTLIAGKFVENERLYGPASLKDKTLIYPFEEFKCRVGCVCKMCRNCEDFEDHEAFHRANHTQCRYNLESVIPTFHYKVVYEKAYYPAVRPQFERFWVKLGGASLMTTDGI